MFRVGLVQRVRFSTGDNRKGYWRVSVYAIKTINICRATHTCKHVFAMEIQNHTQQVTQYNVVFLQAFAIRPRDSIDDINPFVNHFDSNQSTDSVERTRFHFKIANNLFYDSTG